MLETTRLLLSTWAADDHEDAWSLWGDPAVMHYLDRRGFLTRQDVEARLQSEVATQARHGLSYWKVRERATNALVGCSGLRPNDEGDLELGFHLVKAQWGKGYATEVARRVIEHAFGPLGRTRILAGHHPENGGSRAVLLKLGFRSIGTRLYPPTGLQHPWYELT